MLLTTLIALQVLATAPSADEVYAKTRYEDGKAAYDLGHFDAAIVAFEDAWAHAQQPKLLFNLGQAHFQKGDKQKAVFFYERYLETGAATADERALVEGLIAEAKAAAPPPPPTRVVLPPSTARAAEVFDAHDRSEDDEGGVPWLWLGVGAGVVVAGAAVALTVATAAGQPAPAASPDALQVDWSRP